MNHSDIFGAVAPSISLENRDESILRFHGNYLSIGFGKAGTLNREIALIRTQIDKNLTRSKKDT